MKEKNKVFLSTIPVDNVFIVFEDRDTSEQHKVKVFAFLVFKEEGDNDNFENIQYEPILATNIGEAYDVYDAHDGLGYVNEKNEFIYGGWNAGTELLPKEKYLPSRLRYWEITQGHISLTKGVIKRDNLKPYDIPLKNLYEKSNRVNTSGWFEQLCEKEWATKNMVEELVVLVRREIREGKMLCGEIDEIDWEETQKVIKVINSRFLQEVVA